MSKDDEIAVLKARVAELEHAALLTRQPWRRHLYAGATDLQRLVALAKAAHPELVPANLDLESFAVCFAALSTQAFGRVAEPDHRHYVSHWSNLAAAWATANHANADILPATLFLAAVCHGDIPYVLADPTSGTVGALALGDYAGKPATHRWRDVLKGTARLLPPTRPRESRMAPRSTDIRITGGNHRVGAGHVF